MSERAENLEQTGISLIQAGRLDEAIQLSTPLIDDAEGDVAVAAMFVQREVCIMRLQAAEIQAWDQRILVKARADATPYYVIRALCYTALSEIYLLDREKAKQLLDEAMLLTQSVPEDVRALAYARCSQTGFLLKDPNNAVELSVLQTDLAIARKAQIRDLVLGGLDYLSQYYRKSGNIERARDYRVMAIDEARQLGDNTSTSVWLALLARSIWKNDDVSTFQPALDYAQEAVQIAHQLNIPLVTFISTRTLGDLYGNMKNYEAADTYLTEALHVLERIPPDARIASVLFSLAALSLLLNKQRNTVHYGDRFFMVPEAYRTDRQNYCGHVFLWRAFSYLRKNRQAQVHHREMMAARALGHHCGES